MEPPSGDHAFAEVHWRAPASRESGSSEEREPMVLVAPPAVIVDQRPQGIEEMIPPKVVAQGHQVTLGARE